MEEATVQESSTAEEHPHPRSPKEQSAKRVASQKTPFSEEEEKIEEAMSLIMSQTSPEKAWKTWHQQEQLLHRIRMMVAEGKLAANEWLSLEMKITDAVYVALHDSNLQERLINVLQKHPTYLDWARNHGTYAWASQTGSLFSSLPTTAAAAATQQPFGDEIPDEDDYSFSFHPDNETQ